MSNIRATLALRHGDISTTTTTQTVDNATGGWFNYKQGVYWYVDLKTLLGTDWDKYNIFCIRLTSSTMTGVTYPTNATLDINWATFMSGLNWINSSYSVVNKNNTNRASVGGMLVTSGSNHLQYYQQNCNNYFRKGDNMVRIQLEHFRVTDGSIIQSTVGLPHGIFYFDVWGVE